MHTEIVGDPERQISNTEFVTLNASLSYNPNEHEYKQDNIIYIWNYDGKIDSQLSRIYNY